MAAKNIRKYRPKMPFDVTFKLWIPTTQVVRGVAVKDYKEGALFNASVRTYTSDKTEADDIYTPYVTTVLDTWWNPDIKADCVVELVETGERYSLETEPENIDMRHQFMQFRIRKIGGKA